MKHKSRRKVVQPRRRRRGLRERLPSRNVLVGIAAAVAIVAAVAAWLALRPRTPKFIVTPDQNVLLITIDTLRGDALASFPPIPPLPSLHCRRVA